MASSIAPMTSWTSRPSTIMSTSRSNSPPTTAAARDASWVGADRLDETLTDDDLTPSAMPSSLEALARRPTCRRPPRWRRSPRAGAASPARRTGCLRFGAGGRRRRSGPSRDSSPLRNRRHEVDDVVGAETAEEDPLDGPVVAAQLGEEVVQRSGRRARRHPGTSPAHEHACRAREGERAAAAPGGRPTGGRRGRAARAHPPGRRGSRRSLRATTTDRRRPMPTPERRVRAAVAAISGTRRDSAPTAVSSSASMHRRRR